MNNNTSKFPMYEYEKKLSHFGRKVLSVLLEQHHQSADKSGNNSNICETINYRNPYKRTRQHTLVANTFSRTNNLINPSYNNIDNNCSNMYDEEYSNEVEAQLSEVITKSVLKSDELVKCKKDYIVFQGDEGTINKMKAGNSTEQSNHSSFVISNYIDDLSKQHLDTNRKALNSIEKVAWEDMFDSVLLMNQDFNITEASNNAKNTSNVSVNKPPNKILEKDKVVMPKKDSGRIKKNKTNIEDMIPKKVKKVSKEIDKGCKPNFRKQKYTKTVTNWLNDVNLLQVADEAENREQIATNEFGDEINNTKSKQHKIEITFEKSSGKCELKKTVQTKLSNDNGVMKFCKPKDLNITDKEETSRIDINEEKNIKSKFSAPIKSRIPVKDLKYTILFMDDDPHGHLDTFLTVGEEIVMTLLYSDFCQLNGDYAHDIGVPQGAMILIKDKFYYLSTAVSEYKETILQLMSTNTVICYEGKNVLIYLSNHFGLMDSLSDLKIFDAKIGASLLDPDNPPDNFSELQKLVDYAPDFTVATDCPKQKAAWYMCNLRDCWSKVRQALVAQGLWSVFADIEMRVLPIIAAMEHRGVRVDLDKLKSMENLLEERMNSVEQECYKAAGKTFQINSAVQVRTILYDELKLDSKFNVKIRETISKGAKSTSETMLRSLMNKHPLPKLILEYRHLHKAHATFLSGIAHCVRDGVVRPVWEQNAASTGRIASSSPNIQAVPKTPFSLTLFPNESDCHDLGAVNLRSVYASRAGRLLLAADFRQECRVLALAAADSLLLHALRSDDLFRVLAAEWMKKSEVDVTSEERERTKRVVYASVYGAGAGKLAEVLGRGYDHALAVAASFNRTFPSLKSFGRAVVSQCERDGKLRTPCGRTRHFKDITSANYTTKAQAERKAINFIIQGSAADLCKMAMVKTEEQLRGSAPPMECRLLLQIHDELVWEVRDEHLHTAAALIKTAMENCGYECGLPMVLPVALSYGRNWGEMKEFTPEA